MTKSKKMIFARGAGYYNGGIRVFCINAEKFLEKRKSFVAWSDSRSCYWLAKGYSFSTVCYRDFRRLTGLKISQGTYVIAEVSIGDEWTVEY